MLNKIRLESIKWKQHKISASIAVKNITGNDYTEKTARKYMNAYWAMLDFKTGVTGVFGDTHLPFDHPNYLNFVEDTFNSYGVNQIICTGDLVDNHAISRHQNSPNAKGVNDECEMTDRQVQKYIKTFPDLKLTLGNHDLIPQRQGATVGMTSRHIKSMREMWNLPKTWEISERFELNGVVYKHGLGCGGKDGAFNTALIEQSSLVIGHYHSYGGCKYAANNKRIIFGMNVGCGIDVDAYAMEYGKDSRYKPTLGCGIVFNESFGIFVPMPDKYFRS